MRNSWSSIDCRLDFSHKGARAATPENFRSARWTSHSLNQSHLTRWEGGLSNNLDKSVATAPLTGELLLPEIGAGSRTGAEARAGGSWMRTPNPEAAGSSTSDASNSPPSAFFCYDWHPRGIFGCFKTSLSENTSAASFLDVTQFLCGLVVTRISLLLYKFSRGRNSLPMLSNGLWGGFRPLAAAHMILKVIQWPS